MRQLWLHRDIADKIIERAIAGHPIEVCGMVVGPRGSNDAVRHIAMQNAEESPDRYRFDVKEQRTVWAGLDALDEEPKVIYHSHTQHSAWPSETDVEFGHPEFHWVIVSTKDHQSGKVPMRSFQIKGGEVIEDLLVIHG